MTKKKLYNYFLLLSAQILFLLSCAQNDSKQDHLVSTIISSDSVTVYSGKFENNTPVQKIALDENKFRKVLTDKMNKAGKPITVLLKLSPDGGQGGIIGSVYSVIQWSKELGVTSFIIADNDEKNITRFNSAEDTWRYIDSGFTQPHQLDLNFPKEEEVPAEQLISGNTLTCIIFSSRRIYCYQGSDFKQGKYYSIAEGNSFRSELLKLKKAKGDSLTVIIKPADDASYKSTVDILDEMTINKIENYAIVKITKPEESFLQTKSFDWTPPEPVVIKTPNSVTTQALPENNAMLIEIRGEDSVWYKILMKGQVNSAVQVALPITENLSKAIAGFEKEHSNSRLSYLIKGHPKSTYPVFEKVVNSLKQNNIYKYNLVTSD